MFQQSCGGHMFRLPFRFVSLLCLRIHVLIHTRTYTYTYLYIHVLIFYPNNEINVVSGVGRIQTKIEIEKGWCTAETDRILVQRLERRLIRQKET